MAVELTDRVHVPAATHRSPQGQLLHEHKIIHRMLAVAEAALRGDPNEALDPAQVDSITDFIENYADACHHGKEEDVLFAQLAEKDIDESLARDMRALVDDHARIRAAARNVAAANRRLVDGDGSATSEIRSGLSEVIEIYPRHVELEERHFFKPALEHFSAEERAEMADGFNDYDAQLLHQRYWRLIEDLERAMSASVR